MDGNLPRKRRSKASEIPATHRHRGSTSKYGIESLEQRLLLSTVTYTSSISGSWNVGANWNTGNVPQTGDDVVINQPGNVQVTLAGNVSVESLTITDGTLSLQSGAVLTTAANLTNSGSVAVNPDGQIVVKGNYSQTASGSLSMPGGGTTTLPTANFLANSDFESPVISSNGTTPPDSWISSGSAFLSNLYAYTGAQSLQMSGPASSVYQSFAVTPGTSYTLSVFAMSPIADHLTGTEAAYFQVIFLDGGGNPINPGAPVYLFSQGKPPGGPLTGSVGDSGGWNAFNTAAVAPANAVTAKAILIANDTNGVGVGGGSTYWDDPEFGPSVAGPSKLSAVKISNSGVIVLGPTNTITASSTFTQTSTGSLDIQLGGALATGDFGFVQSTGAASLAGTLQSDLVYGYTPSTEDVFTPIEYPSETGSFANTQLPGGTGYQIHSAVTFTNVVLSAVPTTPLTTTVNASSTIQPVSSNLLGANLNWYDKALTTAQTQQMAEAAGLDAYTFPGGSATDDFHFNSVANAGQSSTTTLPQFAQFVQAVGGTGLVTLDYGSGSPQEAAAELAYFEGSPGDQTQLGVGIEWSDANKQWQNVNWGTVGYWASLRGASPLATNDGLNFLRINHSSPFGKFSFWEIGNEEYGSWEVDHHGVAGPGGVSTGAAHDPATYAAFAAQFSSYATEITAAAGLAPISIGIDSGDPSGHGDHDWTQIVLTTGLGLGFVPGFISDHVYVQGSGQENDASLLTDTVSNPTSLEDWTTRYAAYQTLLQQTLSSQAASVKVMATEFNSVPSDPGKQTTSLVNGLFLAESLGILLNTGYSGAFVWDLRDGWVTHYNNSESLYGWREGGDYGLLGDSHTNNPPATAPYVPYPTYFAEQLVSKLVQPGGVVVSASSNYQQFDSYAVMEPNGDLDLLVINANPTVAMNEQFNIQGFQPSGQAQFQQYGETQDTAQSQSSTGASALASFSATLGLTGANFSYLFPAYSMTVIDLAPQGGATSSVSGLATTGVGAGVPNVTIYLDANNNGKLDAGELSTLTNASGAYSFSNVPAGTPVIRQILPAGDTQISPTSGFGIHITVTSGTSLSNENFVDTFPGAPTTGGVSGSVMTTGATPVVGVTVYVDIDNSGTFDAGDLWAVTDANGAYTIANVPAGPQTILQVVPLGDTQTTPGGGGGIQVTVTAGGLLSNENFIDALPTTGSISGTVTTDGAAGIAGATVYVDIDNSDSFSAGDPFAVTDSSGAYTIANVPAGPQTILQLVPTGDTQTSPSGGSGIQVNVTAGGSLANENFLDALPAPGSVSGFVMAGDATAIVGVTVYVDIDNSNTFNAGDPFAVTDATGAYTIANVPAGAQIIRQVLPTGDAQTTPTGGSGIQVNVPAGGTLANENFIDAIPTTGSVSGSVMTGAAAPIPGVTVYVDIDNSNMFNAGDPFDVTDSTGAYTIANVPAGAQIIRQVLPTGDTQTSPTGGGGIQVTVPAGGTLANENFVDAIPTTGSVSGSVTTGTAAPIAGVMVYVDIDNSNTFNTGDLFGLTNSNGTYTIANVPAGPQIIRQVLPTGDTQTTPTGGNGIQVTVPAGGSLSNENFVDAVPAPSGGSVSGSVKTSGGTGVAGLTIYLDTNNNGKLDSGELSAITNASGAYAIANVPAGATIIRQILPSGDTQTSPSGGVGIHVTVTNGGSLVNENFVDTVPATTSNKGSVSGSVKTSAGKGIAGVTIYLDTNNDGKLDDGEFSTKTDSTGAYSLSGVPAGATILRQILPSGYKQTTPSGGVGIHITIKAGVSLTNQNFTDAAS